MLETRDDFISMTNKRNIYLSFYVGFKIEIRINYRHLCSYYCFLTSVDIFFVGVFVNNSVNEFCIIFETFYQRMYDSEKINSSCGRISITHIFGKFTCI